MNDEKLNTLAGKAYEAYCAGVGGVAFNGDLLPNWANFSVDEAKQKQADAWRAAVAAIVEGLDDDIVEAWFEAERVRLGMEVLEITTRERAIPGLRFAAYDGTDWLCTIATRAQLEAAVKEYDPKTIARHRLKRLEEEREELIKTIGEG